MGDPRVQDTLSVLLGIDLKMNEPPKDEKMETEPSPQAPTPPKPATPVKKEKTDQEKVPTSSSFASNLSSIGSWFETTW